MKLKGKKILWQINNKIKRVKFVFIHVKKSIVSTFHLLFVVVFIYYLLEFKFFAFLTTLKIIFRKINIYLNIFSQFVQ